MAFYDMEAPTDRAIFTTSTAAMLYQTAAFAETFIEGLVVSDDYVDFDWSGTSLFLERPGGTDSGHPRPNTNGGNVTLISATHALAVTHAKPAVNETCYWRTPSGNVVSADAAQVIDLGDDQSIIRFATNPSTELNRPPICTNRSLVRYVERGGFFWLLDTDMDIRLRIGSYVSVTDKLVIHIDSSWSNTINTGSGNPCYIALADKTLINAGNVSSPVSNTQAPYWLPQIGAQLAAYGEYARVVSLYYNGVGVERGVERSIEQFIQKGITT